ncbi:hypothetical protein KIN20_010933 [Parelaphostrongylus tenuis]|uniref:Uncharacterized protein n=1 Tax=Parelaphostrongylus tenuis TaxID=148309 RepID=A0AAD5QLQ4_PARTN|nr:hypothetical protein KIN20_010933 [Parelaphostrongylus tenuis]
MPYGSPLLPQMDYYAPFGEKPLAHYTSEMLETFYRAIENLALNAHPSEEAVVIKYRTTNIRTRRSTDCRKRVNMNDLNDDVDVQVLTSVVLEKCTIIPETLRQELEQVLYYLHKRSTHRNKPARVHKRVWRSDRDALPRHVAGQSMVDGSVPPPPQGSPRFMFLREQGNIIGKVLLLPRIGDVELRKTTIRLLFNLSFDAKARSRMVAEGHVVQVTPLIENNAKDLNLLYQLNVNDNPKAMITFTHAMQLLMRDLLSGNGSEVTKVVLLDACAEKWNAQLACGHDNQGNILKNGLVVWLENDFADTTRNGWILSKVVYLEKVKVLSSTTIMCRECCLTISLTIASISLTMNHCSSECTCF